MQIIMTFMLIILQPPNLSSRISIQAILSLDYGYNNSFYGVWPRAVVMVCGIADRCSLLQATFPDIQCEIDESMGQDCNDSSQ